jgi:Ni/Co efflux regulator RcnB
MSRIGLTALVLPLALLGCKPDAQSREAMEEAWDEYVVEPLGVAYQDSLKPLVDKSVAVASSGTEAVQKQNEQVQDAVNKVAETATETKAEVDEAVTKAKYEVKEFKQSVSRWRRGAVRSLRRGSRGVSQWAHNIREQHKNNDKKKPGTKGSHN